MLGILYFNDHFDCHKFVVFEQIAKIFILLKKLVLYLIYM